MVSSSMSVPCSSRMMRFLEKTKTRSHSRNSRSSVEYQITRRPASAISRTRR